MQQKTNKKTDINNRKHTKENTHNNTETTQ